MYIISFLKHAQHLRISSSNPDKDVAEHGCSNRTLHTSTFINAWKNNSVGCKEERERVLTLCSQTKREKSESNLTLKPQLNTIGWARAHNVLENSISDGTTMIPPTPTAPAKKKKEKTRKMMVRSKTMTIRIVLHCSLHTQREPFA